jgi:hypothetical protein
LAKVLECDSHIEHSADGRGIEQAMTLSLEVLNPISTFSEKTLMSWVIAILKIAGGL